MIKFILSIVWIKKSRQAIACLLFGGTSALKYEPFGRVANFRLVQDFRTDWVSSHSTGGDGGDRTHDLLNAIQALSQLSYAPKTQSY